MLKDMDKVPSPKMYKPNEAPHPAKDGSKHETVFLRKSHLHDRWLSQWPCFSLNNSLSVWQN